MTIFIHRDFHKQVRKLKAGEQKKLKQRLGLFIIDSHDPILNNHELKGRGGGYFSINITGDIRAIYKPLRKDAALFLKVDTHSNLYE